MMRVMSFVVLYMAVGFALGWAWVWVVARLKGVEEWRWRGAVLGLPIWVAGLWCLRVVWERLTLMIQFLVWESNVEWMADQGHRLWALVLVGAALGVAAGSGLGSWERMRERAMARSGWGVAAGVAGTVLVLGWHWGFTVWGSRQIAADMREEQEIGRLVWAPGKVSAEEDAAVGYRELRGDLLGLKHSRTGNGRWMGREEEVAVLEKVREAAKRPGYQVTTRIRREDPQEVVWLAPGLLAGEARVRMERGEPAGRWLAAAARAVEHAMSQANTGEWADMEAVLEQQRVVNGACGAGIPRLSGEELEAFAIRGRSGDGVSLHRMVERELANALVVYEVRLEMMPVVGWLEPRTGTGAKLAQGTQEEHQGVKRLWTQWRVEKDSRGHEDFLLGQKALWLAHRRCLEVMMEVARQRARTGKLAGSVDELAGQAGVISAGYDNLGEQEAVVVLEKKGEVVTVKVRPPEGVGEETGKIWDAEMVCDFSRL
jgi:hypothetical protein